VAGYSGTPLAKKLGLTDGAKAYLSKTPETLVSLFAGLAVDATLGKGPYDYIHVFETDEAALKKGFPTLAPRLADAGILWISWPKKASKKQTTLDEGKVRELGLATKLVDVKVCAVDEVWSGLKFVRRVKDRK
jgi:hypothetical protein